MATIKEVFNPENWEIKEIKQLNFHRVRVTAETINGNPKNYHIGEMSSRYGLRLCRENYGCEMEEMKCYTY